MPLQTIAAALPVIGQGLGIVGSLGQLLGLGRNNAADAAKWQQFYLQNYLARRQLEHAEAGEQDALGNRRIYIPGTGWITIAEPTTRTALARQMGEIAQRLGTDSQVARFEREANARARMQERAAADALFNQRDKGYITRQDLTNMLLASNVANAARQAARVGSELALGGLRQGVSSDAAIRMLQGPATTDRVGEIMAAPLRGLDAYEAQEGSRSNRLAGLYNLLANRASMGGEMIVPNVPLDLNNNAARMVAPQALGSAMGLRAPEFSTPNRNVALAGFGSALGEFGRLLQNWLNPPAYNPEQWYRPGAITFNPGQGGY